MNRTARLSLALLITLALGSCAGSAPREGNAPTTPRVSVVPPGAPAADSVTVGLWRFDERVGIRVSDSSPFRLAGTAGPDTRIEFGRYQNARAFSASPQSFVYVPFNPTFESPRGLTLEAWLWLRDVSSAEMSVIAARWSPVPNQQSWVLGVVGRRTYNSTGPQSPGWFQPETTLLSTGRLVFAFRPLRAASTQSFQSSVAVPIGRWVHVAASLDGEVVRLFLDGRLDSQVAVGNGIQRSDAPLVLGNAIDPRRLTDLGGELRLDTTLQPLPFYALNGLLDEVRLSNTARQSFPPATRR
jgi:hypothetical protein